MITSLCYTFCKENNLVANARLLGKHSWYKLTKSHMNQNKKSEMDRYLRIQLLNSQVAHYSPSLTYTMRIYCELQSFLYLLVNIRCVNRQ